MSKKEYKNKRQKIKHLTTKKQLTIKILKKNKKK